MNVETAIIRMVPLDLRRRPVCKPKIVATVPRDGTPHRVTATFEVDQDKEMPYFVRVYADDGRGFEFEVQCAPPDRFRKLRSVTYVQDLIVQPRAS